MSELLKINVNEHTEKKNGLTYLSWAWAWAEVLKVDPQATWAPMFNGPQGSESPWFSLPDGSMLVGVSVAIKGHSKQCMLPVMDHRNKAIKNPDAFAVNTALMRCLAKCIAMHGLGLYIYAGEDLPEQGEPVESPEAKAEREAWEKRLPELEELANFMIDAHQNGKDLDAIRVWYDPATFSADNPTANEERKHVWGLLREVSKLRSAIKANQPEAKAA